MKYYLRTISVLAAPFTEFAPEPEELLRHNVRDLIPVEDLEAAPLRFDMLRAGETVMSERVVRRKDGTLLPVEISGKMLPDGALQAIIRDITKRKQAEEAIRFQSHLLDTVEQVVIATDLSGTIIYSRRVQCPAACCARIGG